LSLLIFPLGSGSGGGGSSVTSVTASAPLASSGGLTPNITLNSPGTAKIIYVSQDTGNDANAGTFNLQKKTIQAGITAAETIAAYYNQVIVMVTPSSTGNGYNENLTMSQQGVVLQSATPTYRSDSALIKGTITINLTGTSGGGNFAAASNIVYIKGFVISTNSGNTVTFSGTTFQRLFLSDTYIDNTGTGSGLVLTNTGTSGGTKSTITCKNSDINNNNATNPTILVSAGRLFISGTAYDIQNGNAAGPAIVMDGASASAAVINMSQATINGAVSISDNTANFNLSLATISSGSAAALVTPATPNTGLITLANVGFTTTATNTITGAGVVALLGNNVKLSTGGEIISTVTQATINSFPQGALMLGATATQNTNTLLTLKNGHLTSQQTTAPTSALQAGAGTTGARTLTRCTDIAGNISITPGGTGIAAGAQLIVTFNKAYATAPVITLTPSNANAGAAGVTGIGAYATSSTTTFTINFSAAGTTGTAYTFYYHVIET
jgi:hypothetical protein